MTEPGASTDDRWSRLYAEHRENQRRARAEPPQRVPKLAFVVLVLFWPAWVALGQLLLWADSVRDDDEPERICADGVVELDPPCGVGVLPAGTG
ncbi:MAG TPA: hypothetical protein VJ804_11805 [Acidimicrobiales bacterium]|nr:hypothetical protein [Acidimicrobiales bacterium]